MAKDNLDKGAAICLLLLDILVPIDDHVGQLAKDSLVTYLGLGTRLSITLGEMNDY